MLKTQFFIFLLIFYIPNALSFLNDTEKADDLLNKIMNRLSQIRNATLDNIMVEVAKGCREFLPELKELNSYKIPEIDEVEGRMDSEFQHSDYSRRSNRAVLEGAGARINYYFDKLVQKIEKSIDMTTDELAEIGRKYRNSFLENQREIFFGVSFWGRGSMPNTGLLSMISVYKPLEEYVSCGALRNNQNYLIYIYKVGVLGEIKRIIGDIFTHLRFYPESEAILRTMAESRSKLNEYLLAHAKELWTTLKRTNTQYFRFCDRQNTPWINDVRSLELRGYLENGNSGSALQDQGSGDQSPKNKKRIYLGRLESREADNYVVVGTRFNIKKNVPLHSISKPGDQYVADILYLQPAEGKLNPNGTIVDKEWVSLPDAVLVEDTAVLDSDHRSFFLGDIQLGPQYVVTGIKFDAVERGEGIKGFSISVSGRPLNYKTGKLNLTHGIKRYIRPLSTEIEKKLTYKLEAPKPEDLSNFQIASSEDFTYVTIENIGKTTLPFFDGTPVFLKHLTPLGGISLFHKGTEKNSGFISVRVNPLNYAPFLEDLKDGFIKSGVKEFE